MGGGAETTGGPRVHGEGDQQQQLRVDGESLIASPFYSPPGLGAHLAGKTTKNKESIMQELNAEQARVAGQEVGGAARAGAQAPRVEEREVVAESADITVNELLISGDVVKSVRLVSDQLIVRGNVPHKTISAPISLGGGRWKINVESARQHDGAIGERFIALSGGRSNTIGLAAGVDLDADGARNMNFMFSAIIELDTGGQSASCELLIGQSSFGFNNPWAIGGPNVSPNRIGSASGLLALFSPSGELDAMFRVVRSGSYEFIFSRVLGEISSSRTYSDWMGPLQGGISVGMLNLPGTHDSAAIWKPGTLLRFWDCQARAVTSQLRAGIRLLDFRFKVKKNNNSYEFKICHGDVGLGANLNEYPQTLEEVMAEVDVYLDQHQREFVAVSLKIDDWGGLRAEEAPALSAMSQKLHAQPRGNKILDSFSRGALPTLDQARGKILLINRINQDPTFGVPVAIPDDTVGALLPPTAGRSFSVYTQDSYDWNDVSASEAVEHKLALFSGAMSKPAATGADLFINFATGVRLQGTAGVYIEGGWLAKLGKEDASAKPQRTGWCLFDFEGRALSTNAYGPLRAAELVIDSNLGGGASPSRYARFGGKFEVQANNWRDEL
jgi:hypothetical protein